MALDVTLERLLTEDIFSLVGLSSISDEEKEALLHEMETTVMARVYSNLLAGMGEDDAVIFQNTPPEQLEDYLAQHDIDLGALVTEESIRYRIELADEFQDVVAAEAAVAASA